MAPMGHCIQIRYSKKKHKKWNLGYYVFLIKKFFKLFLKHHNYIPI